MSSQYIDLPVFGTSSWKPPVSTAVALPAVGNTNGDARVVLDTDLIYVWNGSAWINNSGGGGSPGGAVTSIQYNASGSFGGFGTWAGNILTIPGDVSANRVILNASAPLVYLTYNVGTGFVELWINAVKVQEWGG